MTQLKTLTLITAFGMLTACTNVDVESTTFSTRHETLTDGTKILYSGHAPKAEYQCLQLGPRQGFKNHTMSDNFKMGGQYEGLRDRIFAYVGKLNLHPNYIRAEVPTSVDVGGFRAKDDSTAYATFYSCKNLPK